MKNKLLEILEELNTALDSCSPINDTSEFRLLLKEKFVEYARSKIPEKIGMPTGDALRFAYDKEHYTGYNHCIRRTKADIEEDLQTLNN